MPLAVAMTPNEGTKYIKKIGKTGISRMSIFAAGRCPSPPSSSIPCRAGGGGGGEGRGGGAQQRILNLI